MTYSFFVKAAKPSGADIFGNHAKAEMSALYHTFIATCQMMGMSVLKYFKSLFPEIVRGRTDYENMLPMTIGLCRAA